MMEKDLIGAMIWRILPVGKNPSSDLAATLSHGITDYEYMSQG